MQPSRQLINRALARTGLFTVVHLENSLSYGGFDCLACELDALLAKHAPKVTANRNRQSKRFTLPIDSLQPRLVDSVESAASTPVHQDSPQAQGSPSQTLPSSSPKAAPGVPSPVPPPTIDPTDVWVTLGSTGYQGEMFDWYSKRIIDYIRKYEFQQSTNPSEWSRTACQKASFLSQIFSLFTSKYLIDLCPSTIYAAGPLVGILAKSGVGESSVEFQLVKAVFYSSSEVKPVFGIDSEIIEERLEHAEAPAGDTTLAASLLPVNSLENLCPSPVPVAVPRLEMEKIPSSKEDVFVSTAMSLIEKRKVMKFFTFCLEFTSQDAATLGDKTFHQLVLEQKLSPRFTRIISQGLTLRLNPSLAALEGIQALQLYFTSLGRFGPSSLLSAVYGTGPELCQAFSRYAAVWGTSFMLESVVSHIQAPTATAPGLVQTAHGDFESDIIVCSEAQLGFVNKTKSVQEVNYIVVISQHPILDTAEHSVLLLSPPGREGIWAVQFPPELCINPEGTWVLSMWTRGSKELLKKAAEQITTLHPALCVAYTKSTPVSPPQPGMIVTHQASVGVSIDDCVHEARQIFERLCPGHDFYPPKPEVHDEDD
ncbi:hypothetical protein HDV03_004995 [Kappamyces sp. JEL0829]|nr:hypothetical protein HDV03_004995 [Kappamyces sp. JEL0829]